MGLNGLFGANWRSTYDRSILLYEMSGKVTAAVYRPDGKIVYFDYMNGAFISTADANDRLSTVSDSSGNALGYSYFSASDNEVESYDINGRLTAITNRVNVRQTLGYDQYGNLISVTDSFGRKMKFNGGSTINTMIDPEGRETKYQYDPNQNLTSVTYPGGKVRQYLYEDSRFLHALTGIIDENGARYATWQYDEQGHAISSEHAGGAEKVTFLYGADNVQVTDALNSIRTYNFETVLGVIRSKGQSQPGGSGCEAASIALEYDANGNLASRTDFNGNKTTYEYDLARNLETKRVEAFGKPQARTVITEWHPVFRFPTRIAEPKRLTTYGYDDRGNLLSRTEQATNDPDGSQGLTAATIGTPRTWRYTYNDFGQVLTATGPRTDIVDKTIYEYDANGNLIKITNGAGYVTALSNYDANGRVGRITDPNGMNTDLAYNVRGWVVSKTVGGETTTYDYDDVGQLIKTTQPDGTYLTYIYDDAHRLTSIVDNAGNRIDYTLDAMSNRTREEVKDASGVLARQITRMYDALNRLQQITGARQ
jgi:YD repeat-containing protein